MRKLLLLVLFLASTCVRGISQNGLVQNETFLYGPNTYLIATLPPNNGADYDHLHLLATLNSGWAGWSNTFLDMTFGNRGTFTYLYTARGATLNSAVKVTAYSNSDSSVSIYLMLVGQFTDAGYSILEADEEAVNASPTSLASAPTGTLIFDTSSTSYPPANFTTFTGSFGVGTPTPGSDLANLPSAPLTSTPIFEVNGDIALIQGGGGQVYFADGTVQTTAWNGTTLGGDYAEAVDVLGDRAKYEPGDLIVIDAALPGRFTKSDKSYSKLVAGVFSTKPGLVGRRTTAERPNKDDEVPMAMMGIVPTKVSTENGPVKPGDLLVSSSRPGYAMKGTERPRMMGAVIGKALAPLKKGSGVIEVLVSLQ